MSSAHVPIRMCIGCGGRAPQAGLLRVASAADGSLMIAHRSRASGRSGYLHGRPECWDRFAARKGPVRSLGRNLDKALRLEFVQGLKENLDSVIVKD